MKDSIFTPTPESLQNITAPSNEASIGVVASKEDGVGIEGSISKDLGKGWELEAAGTVKKKTTWNWGIGAFLKKVWK